jgi:hypothetical protein
MMQTMRLLRSLRRLEDEIEGAAKDAVRCGRSDTALLVRNIGWVSAGITVLALGLVIGRELRQRYKFNRRTPYDAYAHSGDSTPDVEFGVGV